MTTSLEAAHAASEADRSERALNRRVQWFVEKWTTQMDLNKRDAAELSADLVMVIQEVHRDASRTTHELLRNSLAAMPAPQFIVPKSGS
jgi:hypothetical protein